MEINEIRIGNVAIKQTAVLAPMASVADRAYRTICKEFGASYVVGEMASAKGLFYSDKKTSALLTVTPAEMPMAVQLFGDDPDFMARAAVTASKYNPQIIDVNMGCPVPKVAGNGSGSALMKNPETAYKIVKAMTQATDIPITVKIRKGWDDNSVNAVEFARLMEEAGASAVTIHGRTRQQMYKPPVDLDIIKAVKSALTIPVIGNGGITTPQEAKFMYEYTGCDLVMIGQATYGRPWIFAEIEEFFKNGIVLPPPTMELRLSTMLRHVSMIVEDIGEKAGMREARKHAAWYIKGTKGAAAFRRACASLEKYSDLTALVDEIRQIEN